MSRTTLTRQARDTLDAIKSATGVSPRFIRTTSRGHYLFDFAGFRTTISATPSDGRGRQNAIADVVRHLKGQMTP